MLQQAIEKFQQVMDDASAMLTEAETEEALAAHELAMSNTPEYQAVLKASARARDAAKKVAELEAPEVTANIKRIIEARRAVLEKLQAQQKATRGFQKTERIATATLNEAEDLVKKAKAALDNNEAKTSLEIARLQDELANAEELLSEFRARELVQQLGEVAHEKRKAYGLAKK
jgi:cbb3-type cytochrome oxidase cytochrome c subunit